MTIFSEVFGSFFTDFLSEKWWFLKDYRCVHQLILTFTNEHVKNTKKMIEFLNENPW